MTDDAKAADAPKAARRKAEVPLPVAFESREREPTAFDVARISPTRNFSNGRLEWVVKPDDLARFESHYHVQSGRVVRKHVD